MHRTRALARKLADQEIWFVGSLVVASLIDEHLLAVCILVAIVFWIVRWVGYGYPSTRTAADWSIFLLVLAIPVTLWVTPVPEITKPQVYRLLTGVLMYYAIVNWAISKKRLRLATLVVMLAGVFLSLYALVSVEWAVRKWFSLADSIYQFLTPWVSDTANPNVMAGSLVLILPLVIGGLFADWGTNSWLYRIISGISAVMIAGILALTLSRGALIALAIALVIFVVIRWRWGWVLMVFVTIGLGIVVYQVGSYPLVEAVLSGTSIGSLDSRMELWSRAILMARDFPFTGIGMGMTGQVSNQLFPLMPSETVLVSHSHNLFMQVLVDLGLGGLIGWSATLILAICLAWRVFKAGSKRAARGGWIAGIGAGLLCSQLALILHGLTDSVTWGMVRPAPLVWALWGLIMALGNAVIEQNLSEA